jgi:hypothetical protein
MNILNKFFVFFLAILLLFSTNVFAATNKETLISKIAILGTKLNTLKTTKTSELETAVSSLSTSFNSAVSDL